MSAWLVGGMEGKCQGLRQPGLERRTDEGIEMVSPVLAREKEAIAPQLTHLTACANLIRWIPHRL